MPFKDEEGSLIAKSGKMMGFLIAIMNIKALYKSWLAHLNHF